MTVIARWVGVTQEQVVSLNQRCTQVWNDWEAYNDPAYDNDWYAEGRTSRLDTWFNLRVLDEEKHEIMMYLPDRRTLAHLDVVRWMGSPLFISDLKDDAIVVYPYHPKLLRKPSLLKRLLRFFKRG